MRRCSAARSRATRSCPGDDEPSTVYQSNLSDFAMTVKDVGARLSPPAASSAGGFKSTLKLYLVDYAGYCADYGQSIKHAASHNVKLQIERLGTTTADATLGPGTFFIDHVADGDGNVYLGRQSLDATCKSSATALPFALASTTTTSRPTSSATPPAARCSSSRRAR